VALFVFVITLNSYSQNAKSFLKLSCPEKRWVLCHLFIAKGAYKISQEATNKTLELTNNITLDSDQNGGQLDAFRHAYWMARITQKYSWRAASTLGKAHEKGNYRDFKKHRTEDGTFPDAQSCQMDFLNNDAGIELGKNNPTINKEELSLKIIDLILTGKLYKIKKDRAGQYLKCNGEIISADELKGKWETPKCVLPSNL
jgi:hypothetical protein